MGYAEKRDDYWRGRFKVAPGKYGTVADDKGATIRFRTKRQAENAANDAEAKVRRGAWRDPTAGRTLFGDYVNVWYERQDLAASTLQVYRRHIESHLLPEFETTPIADIDPTAIADWERREKSLGYAESSVGAWRAVLHIILADAFEERLILVNPAARRRGRGKRTGQSRNRGPEKTITTALGILLIAERAALLSGRDDEFVSIVAMGFTGMRWAENVGLETQFVRLGSIRVEWQLYELDTGELLRCPPKDGSYRTIRVPDFLSTLVTDHITRTQPKPCNCHDLTYVFGGHRPANGAARQQGAVLIDVARRAGVSPATVSSVLNHPDTVAEPTRATVEAAIADLKYIRGAVSRVPAGHWRRNGFATWLFQPAATGWYPKKAPYEARPVPILGEPWPGVPVRGRGASERADACWLPVARGLTPHGLRHSYKTLMLELGTPPALMDEQMGHSDGSVQAVYSHGTAEMWRRLLDGLTAMWTAALDDRRRMSPGSPVAVLDSLLKPR